MGGRSSEREVSLTSGRSVLEALDPERYEVSEIEIGANGKWQLPRVAQQAELGRGPALPVPAANGVQPFAEIDVVFPVLHGPFGEDGTVQGLLELAGIAYVGAGVAASALCMDKDLFKSVMRDKGIPVAASVTARMKESSAVENPFDWPCVVKPARLGSSVGITIA